VPSQALVSLLPSPPRRPRLQGIATPFQCLHRLWSFCYTASPTWEIVIDDRVSVPSQALVSLLPAERRAHLGNQ